DMIKGYSELNQNISHTITLISDIEHASKEQLEGIEQINDAVTQLDQQTQQNAMVASQTHDVAVLTDEIAKLVVNEANAKEFLGKNEVQGKPVNNPTHHLKVPEVKKSSGLKIQSSKKKTDTTTSISKINSVSQKENEWESF
ncbi:MAG: hypothetical protein M0P43_09515, partial [Arcobacteraceae bacterium]|nr:hypothetical protein [Arcobacteraceae bacterium]